MLILLVAAAAVAYLVWDSYFKGKDRKTNDEQQTTQKVEEAKEDKKEERASTIEEDKDEKKVVQYEGEDPNKAEGLSGAITYVGVNGDGLMIRVNIDQFLDSGECALSLMRGGVVIYSETVNVVGSATTATCEGFDVPVAQLGAGSVEINILVNAGGKTGAIDGRAEL